MSDSSEQLAASPTPSEPLAITDDMLDPLDPPPPPGPRDFERGMSYWPLVTLCLITANLAAFIWMLRVSNLNSAAAYVSVGALHRESVQAGEWWRLITAPFLHAGIDHLLGNMLMLYALGMACEHAFGRLKSIALYLGCALGGSILSVIMFEGPSVGASGAVFGLAGIVIAFFWRHQARFHLRDKRVGGVLLAWAIYTVALGFFQPQIDNWCHIGGFLIGLLLGVAVPPRPPMEEKGGFFVAATNSIR